MDYRFATVNDAAALAVMNHALIQDEGHRNRMSIPELEQRMRKWLAGEYRAVLFDDGPRPVGYALYRRNPDDVYVRQFYVIAERRRRGIGRAALDWLRRNAWPRETRIRLDVLVDNAAGLAFWRAVGFKDYCLTLEMESRG